MVTNPIISMNAGIIEYPIVTLKYLKRTYSRVEVFSEVYKTIASLF